MAGYKSRARNPFIADFILVGQRLAKLGFIYHYGSVIVIESEINQGE